MNWFRKLFKIVIVSTIVLFVIVLIINILVDRMSNSFIHSDINEVPECYTGIVLGARVSESGRLSVYLKDRIDNSLKLYKSKKIKRFLLSGDHGRTNYDEVNSMKAYLIKHGIRTEDIFLDHAGFDTYSSMYRARDIFQVKDAIIISQEFHLPRAVYIARRLGIEAHGFIADRQKYAAGEFLEKREYLANIKAFIELLIHKEPKYLGDKIPINGRSDLSYD